MQSYFKSYLILIILAIFAAPSLYSEMSKQDQSFYAISSLCFHLKTALSDQAKDIFTSEDVSELWNSACENNQLSNVILARDLYYQSQSENEKSAHSLLAESQMILEEVWKRSNVYLQHPDQVMSKGKVNNEVDKALKRNHLLPKNSLLRASMDKIFTSPDMNKDIKTLLKSRFKVVSRSQSGMYVLKHPHLKGYLIKAYPGIKKKETWQWLVFRCWGVSNVRKLIKDKKLKNFVVPNKWIYPLAKHQLGKDGDYSKVKCPAVLLVKDMNLATIEESYKAWKSKVTKSHIDELYMILSHGYASCRLAENIPLTKKGKFACIDTQHPVRSLNYSQLDRYLSKKMKRYFYQLIKSGGKKMHENKRGAK